MSSDVCLPMNPANHVKLHIEFRQTRSCHFLGISFMMNHYVPNKGFIDLPDRYVKQFDISENTFINIKLLPIVATVPRPVE